MVIVAFKQLAFECGFVFVFGGQSNRRFPVADAVGQLAAPVGPDVDATNPHERSRLAARPLGGGRFAGRTHWTGKLGCRYVAAGLGQGPHEASGRGDSARQPDRDGTLKPMATTGLKLMRKTPRVSPMPLVVQSASKGLGGGSGRSPKRSPIQLVLFNNWCSKCQSNRTEIAPFRLGRFREGRRPGECGAVPRLACLPRSGASMARPLIPSPGANLSTAFITVFITVMTLLMDRTRLNSPNRFC